MKKFLISHFSFLIFILLFNSCKEVGPTINLKNNQNVVSDSTYIESPVATAELKNVVLEEFTGVNCPNCPQGHLIIANIKTANPNRLISISFHPINGFGTQFPFSVQNLTTQAATDLMMNYFTWPGFEPISAVDRKLFSGESAVLIDKGKWATKVTSEITETSPVNIKLESSYDSTIRELTIVTELHYTQNVTEENKMTVLLTEGDIVTAQLDGTVKDTFYVHKDIMRTFISDLQGDAIDTTRVAGRVIRKVYKKVLDVVWKPENMKIVAYVHEYQNSKDIYQGKEISVK